ncbi:MAG: hypothetical protein LBB72_03230 [Spirochaetaceae bacterium]|jgi:hypothetical protein|nr:hypothetical protein [Spirochaetaceae bacterium]
MSDTPDNASALALVNTIKRRIESRYTRLLFVHKELAGLDAAAKQQEKLTPSGSFEDFVFSRIDFSVYKKIDAEEFRLLFDDGLADYSEAFYQKAFNMNREEVRGVIARSYIQAGPFYVCKQAGHLILSIMRTLHTSLEFAPIIAAGELSGADQLRLMAELLDGTVIRHSDNSETKLFVPGKNSGSPLLCGTFYPLGKACTITLIP